MEHVRILVIAAEAVHREQLTTALEEVGFEAVACAHAEEAARGPATGAEAVVVHESVLGPRMESQVIETLSVEHPHLPCLVVTASSDVDCAVELMRRGAYSVVTLPLGGSRLATQVTQALRHRDLSLRNQQLSRSLDVHERLAMIGKLAAGVAHELNSPLDGVLRFVNLAVDSMPKESPQIPYLIEARRGLRRMADIVRDLLQFSRNAAVEIADEDAERLARDAVAQIVEQQGHKRIETAFSFPAGGIQLPRGMFQVLGNLAKNAADAMPKGGSIDVSATLHDGRIRIDVRDSGTGIPEEIHDRVFEPFFTTKEVGSGTGLGLSICQRIVERLGGSMSMQSVAGQGTTVSVELPTRRRIATPPAKPVTVQAGRRE